MGLQPATRPQPPAPLSDYEGGLPDPTWPGRRWPGDLPGEYWLVRHPAQVVCLVLGAIMFCVAAYRVDILLGMAGLVLLGGVWLYNIAAPAGGSSSAVLPGQPDVPWDPEDGASQVAWLREQYMAGRLGVREYEQCVGEVLQGGTLRCTATSSSGQRCTGLPGHPSANHSAAGPLVGQTTVWLQQDDTTLLPLPGPFTGNGC